MIKEIITGLVFSILGLAGLMFRKKIVNWSVTGHAGFYGSLFGKKVEKSLIKDKEEKGVFSGIIWFGVVFPSLGFLFFGIVILVNAFR